MEKKLVKYDILFSEIDIFKLNIFFLVKIGLGLNKNNLKSYSIFSSIYTYEIKLRI